MPKPDREVEPFFSQPIRQVTLIAITLLLFAAGAYLAFPSVQPVFLSNPWLNGVIIFVFIIGLFSCLWQLAQLMRAVSWIVGFTRMDAVAREPGNLLAPLAVLLRDRGASSTINATSARSILDSVSTRIEEARDVTRYLANLLIFLGLLGTFYGLAITVPAVVQTIRGLAPSGDSGVGAAEMFNTLMSGLEGQLGGMGTAFASSLLGLTGSLVIGLVELFVNHGQNRFSRELEDWLSSITRLGYAGVDGEAAPETAVMAAFAEHVAEQMDRLTGLMTESDASRARLDERLGVATEALDRMAAGYSAAKPSGVSDQVLAQLVQAQQQLVAGQAQILAGQERLVTAGERLIEAQQQALVLHGQLLQSSDRVAQTLEEVSARETAEAASEASPHAEAEMRMRLRSIDVQLLRILEEMAAGRQESTLELRSDIAALTRVLRQAVGSDLAEDYTPPPPRRG